MGETPDRIARHIDATRDMLYANMQELERKVRSAADWREHVKRHPNMIMALVLGAGVMLGRRVTRRAHRYTDG